jgi:hypothetical protein
MDIRVFEDKLGRLPGVEAVRVVHEGTQITEIHLLAAADKPAKQLVRDVQSLSQAAFGTPIDRRVVSVVQLKSEDLASGDRPMIDDVTELTDGNRTRVGVNLSWHGENLVGEVVGAAASSTRLRLVAEATLEALRQALHEETAFAISSVDIPTLGSRQVAIAQVVIVSGAGERLMVGSAVVGGDPARAVVRAVLDALNRHIPDLRR